MNVSCGRPAQTPAPGLDKATQTDEPPSRTTLGGHSLTPASTPATAWPQQHETARALAAVSLPDASSTCQRTGIQSLPQEVLRLIFGYLAVSTHSQCALVCRHWYNSLPTTRQRAAQWLESLCRPNRQRISQLAMGYRSRTGPLLARPGHALWPILERQHQELVRLQQAHQRPGLTPDTRQLLRHQERTAYRVLSGLIGYSLQHSPLQTGGQLRLKPVSCHPPVPEPVLTVTGSICNRWLAVRCQRDHGVTPLYLYGWRDGSWHQETLVPAPVCSVTRVEFARQMLDTLFTIQGAAVFVWRRAADSGHWCAEKLYEVPFPWLPYNIIVSEKDDLICLSRKRRFHPSGLRIQISVCLTGLQCWEHLPPQLYRTVPKVISFQYGFGMLALLFGNTTGSNPARTDSVLILGKGLDARNSWLWSAQLYRLKVRTPPLDRIKFSPNGHYLLGLADTRLYLWELDTQNKILLMKLRLSCWHPHPQSLMAQTACFRNNEKQLVVLRSSHRLELWNLHENGDWLAGTSIETPSTFDVDSHHQRRALQLYSEREILAIQNLDTLLVWHQAADGQWQFVLQRHNNSTDASFPLIFQRGFSTAVYTQACETAAAGPRLWIHAPDLAGQLIRQVRMVIPGSLFSSSADGLSLVIKDHDSGRLCFLQLARPQDNTPQQPDHRPQ